LDFLDRLKTIFLLAIAAVLIIAAFIREYIVHSRQRRRRVVLC
jgi:hypothetical protein